MYNIIEYIKTLYTKCLENKINWKYIINKEDNSVEQIYYVSKTGYTISICFEDDYFKLEVDDFIFFFHKEDNGYNDIKLIWELATSDNRINRTLKFMMFGD